MRLKFRPMSIVEKTFPVIKWARSYDSGAAIADAVAGFTVALTLIPQSIAYASLAGLDAQYGLYSSLSGGFVYLVLGTCPEINIGPTALLSLLTFTYTNGTSPDLAVLLCFLGGCVQLFAGVTRLGFLLDFVSMPVVSGFTSASSLIIACAQLKGLLGLSFNAEKFVDIWKEAYINISQIRMPDAILSAICCVTLLALKQLKEIKLKPAKSKEDGKKKVILEKVIWFVSVGRNATIVLVCTVVAYILHSEDGINPFKLTGNIESGLPAASWPPFSSQVRNTTYSFTDMVQHLGSGIVVTPLLGIIANVAIAKAFVKGTTLDATQEMVALGVCNLVGSLFRSYPANGSFSRSAVSNASGVRTTAAGFYTGVVVLLTLSFLTPYFYFIPKAALASVIVCAVLFMIDVTIVKELWIGKSKLDLIPLFGTFFACLLLDVTYGILVGIAIDLIILLFYNARPTVRVEEVTVSQGVTYTVITPSGGLFFPSSNHFRDLISRKIPTKDSDVTAVVIDCRDLHRADWTTLQCIKSLSGEFKLKGIRVIFLNMNPGLLAKMQAQIGRDLQHFENDVDQLSQIKRQALEIAAEPNDEIQEIKLSMAPQNVELAPLDEPPPAPPAPPASARSDRNTQV